MSPLSESIERLTAWLKEFSNNAKMTFCNDIRAVVEAAKQLEHQADDGEPVTEEWLRSIGFTCRDDRHSMFLSLAACHDSDLLAVVHRERLTLDFELCGNGALANNDANKKQATRGDVRRLMAALGIVPQTSSGEET